MNQPASSSGATGPVLTPVGKWVAGARPKTLGAAISPVLVGTAAATADGPLRWWRALAALV
ncbi:MAG TPA: 1,4-dihydroxy-2-naphthoate polyprenyltransferase, partial [Acidimicrobiia bacterium]|nr:1,4-dihydroxy-2-naphthoate polyprenyltransferase [Acidimicrobiia bacterium]